MGWFQINTRDGRARTAALLTPHGRVQTPAFMPVGTAGAVRGLLPDRLTAAGVQIILANTYHLMLRPGAEATARMGGIHALSGWSGPILTDSGGYQVFSLAHRRRIDSDGVTFQSHIDGAPVRLSPERAIEIQQLLGADIVMQLDECPSAEATRDDVAAAVERSLDWARRCRSAWQAGKDRAKDGSAGEQALFGIQQGGVFEDLRARSAAGLVELDLPGYAVGGLGVGEGPEQMHRVLDAVDEQFPADRPRYLMGVGEPRDILAAVARGIDLFDCVLPTRNGRNAQAFTWSGRLRLRNARWADDRAPLDADCDCYTCRNFSRAALRHFFQAGEMSGPILVSLHNVRFFMQLMASIRQAITTGDLTERTRRWMEALYAGPGEKQRAAGDCV